MHWTYTQLIAMVIIGVVAAGVAFTMGASAIGTAFSISAILVLCCTLLAYLNGYRQSRITE